MKTIYSNIGKHATVCKRKFYRKNIASECNGSNFSISRSNFAAILKDQGYVNVKQNGNYITASKRNDNTIIYFAWHNERNTNFMVNKYISQRVDYFAFCTPDNSHIYIVSYDKVSKYCKTKDHSVVFNNGEEKLFISDSWVDSQIATAMF